MKVSGFSFVKNALIYDYPVVEAITSILPICDEFVVAVGKSEDDTLELIRSIDPVKVRIVETDWDESLREGGRVLAKETDKAFQAISKDSDWAFYIQGDEVVHEKYLENILRSMLAYKDHAEVDGLLFDYLHFYGSYNYVGSSSKWYTHEIRVVRNDPRIYSYRDAQGFRKCNNQKLQVIPIDATMYHYGWVKDPRAMQKKRENFNKLWHSDKWIDLNIEKTENFDYEKHVSELSEFQSSHPEVMKKRIAEKNWDFTINLDQQRPISFKEKIKKLMKHYLGIDADYKNYTLINSNKS